MTSRATRPSAGWPSTASRCTRPGGAPQRRAFTFLDAEAERAIAVVGERHVPAGEDPLPWERLADAAGVYFPGGDAGALSAARRAGVLVATPRARGPLADSEVVLDALVRSGTDPGEAYARGDVRPAPRLVVTTLGALGGGGRRRTGRRARGRRRNRPASPWTPTAAATPSPPP